ncbi:hypothetical protein DFH06DRAFT_1161367 [Mycena polygramma]|nr:hypothetical protein DFH06DRAFT_1161367 [Mycena polygramma]
MQRAGTLLFKRRSSKMSGKTKGPAASLSATPPTAASSSSESSSASSLSHSELQLLKLEHVLAVKYGDLPRPGPTERDTMHLRAAALQSLFPRESAQKKFARVLQSVVTLCDAEPGSDNIAAMIALSQTQVKIFVCQGAERLDVQAHLMQVWGILQELRKMRTGTENKSLEDPEEPERALAAKMFDLAYNFAAKKAVQRVKKRHVHLRRLHEQFANDPSVNDAQKEITTIFMAAAITANSVSQTGLQSSDHWANFRACLRLLYSVILDPDYRQNVEDLEVRARKLGFDNFTKCLDKAVKIQLAGWTLVSLALSPTRGWITDLPLEVVQIPIPASSQIRIPMDAFDAWVPSAEKRTEFQQNLRSVSSNTTETEEGEVVITTEVHPECELVARVVDNDTMLDDVELVRYVASAKLHCFCCYSWFKALNVFHVTRCATPVAFDGSHGGITPGWLPPSLEAPFEKVVSLVQRSLEDELHRYTHTVTLLRPDDEEDLARFRALEAVDGDEGLRVTQRLLDEIDLHTNHKSYADPLTEEEVALKKEALAANGETLVED